MTRCNGLPPAASATVAVGDLIQTNVLFRRAQRGVARDEQLLSEWGAGDLSGQFGVTAPEPGLREGGDEEVGLVSSGGYLCRMAVGVPIHHAPPSAAVKHSTPFTMLQEIYFGRIRGLETYAPSERHIVAVQARVVAQGSRKRTAPRAPSAR
jgi:hypothetical protein